LFEADLVRIHLLALTLAHLEARPTEQLVTSVLSQPVNDVLGTVLLDRPHGLRRVLGVLPEEVMPKHNYCDLVSLFRQPAIATFLQHHRSIDVCLLNSLISLTPPLRRPGFIKLIGRLEHSQSLVSGLRIISRRLDRDFDTLAKEIGALSQPKQIMAKIANLVEGLPLPNCLPPTNVGPFLRCDSASQIRLLAKKWRNCLIDFVDDINEGNCAVYVALNEQPAAAVLVKRMDRLGWFVDEIKGRRNTDLPDAIFGRYQQLFDRADVPPLCELLCVKDIVLKARWGIDH
jgi:hypothetical protein